MSSAQWLSAVLNAVWQGAVLALGAAVLLRYTGRRVPAATRYGLWWAVLLALVLMPFAGLLVRGPVLTSVSAAAALRAGAGLASDLEPVAGDASVSALPAEIGLPVEAEPAPAQNGSAEPWRPARLSFVLPVWAVRGGLSVLAAGALAGLAAVLGGLLRVRALRRSFRPLQPEQARVANAVRARCGLTRGVRIGVSAEVDVPATLGFFRPVVLLPGHMAAALAEGELAHVLAHELGHVARRDDWARLAQRALAALFFFHPGVRLAARRLDREREFACDDWALGRTGAPRLEYARSLLRVGELAMAGRGRELPAAAVSMAGHLESRIETLLSARARPPGAGPRAFIGVFAPLLLFSGAGLNTMSAIRIEAGGGGVASEVRNDPALPLTDVLTRYEAWGLHGAVLVVHEGRVLIREGYGLADRANGTRWTAETAFNGGAVAKMLTAAAILKLEEEGRLRITDRLERYLGPFPAPKSDVTIHQLLVHTAGIARPWAPIYRDDIDDFIAAMKETPADFPAGLGFRYTDHGPALLAALVEVVSGMPYEAYVRRALLEPAGMTHTRFENEPPTAAPLATEYAEAAGTASRVGNREYRWGRKGAMGVITTIDDLYKWHLALQQRRVLGEASIQRMFTGYVSDGRSTRIGYGWEAGHSARGTRIHHRLSGWGSNSIEILHDLDERLFIVIVANTHVDWARPKYEELVNAVLGEPVLLPPEPLNTPVSEIQSLAGRYAADGVTINVEPAGTGALLLNITGARRRGLLEDDAATLLARQVGPGRFAVLHWARHRLVDISVIPGPAPSLHLAAGALSLKAIRLAD